MIKSCLKYFKTFLYTPISSLFVFFVLSVPILEWLSSPRLHQLLQHLWCFKFGMLRKILSQVSLVFLFVVFLQYIIMSAISVELRFIVSLIKSYFFAHNVFLSLCRYVTSWHCYSLFLVLAKICCQSIMVVNLLTIYHVRFFFSFWHQFFQ